MYKIVVFCFLVGCAVALYPNPKASKAVQVDPPQPYEFNFDIVDEDGNKQGRQESGDAHGNKKGSYSMQLADGRQRWVEYISDKEGTRMIIRTNEPGTDDQDPADVDLTVEGPIKVKEAPKPKERKYKTIKVPISGY